MNITWDVALEDWSDWLIAAGRARSTVRLRCYQVGRLRIAVEPGGPWDVTADDLVRWLARQQWDADTRRGHRAAVRSFYGWAVATGRLDRDPAAHLPSTPAKPGRPRPAPEDAIRQALASADERDALLIRLGAEAGLRACEMATCHRDRLTRAIDGWQLEVIGKGGKHRIVPLGDGLAAALRRQGPGWTFPGRQSGHLSAAYISKRLARVLPGALTGHTLRHRFGSAAYFHERDLRAVQTLLGHASPATTARYVAVPDGALRRAVLAVAA